MESLLNFNFLKDISVKKNNENNTNDKISMRIIPIYNIRDPTYIYYSEIVNI